MLQRLKAIRHFAFDLDGTICRGPRLLPGVRRLFKILHDLDISFTFVTNNSSQSTTDTMARLHRLGLEVAGDQISTSATATRDYLQMHYPRFRRIYVLGTPSAMREWQGAGYDVVTHDVGGDEPQAVVVGLDQTLTYDRLCEAAYWIKQGKTYLATHLDRFCPAEDGRWLVDCGAICGCLRVTTGRRPDAVVGKPDPFMLRQLMTRHTLGPHEVVMVGDRLSTDIASAHRAGVMSVLVLTGDASARDVQLTRTRPDLVVPTMELLADLLAAAHGHAHGSHVLALPESL